MPSHPATVEGAAFYGCITEATEARALSGATTSSENMTLEKCSEFCGSSIRYFGVEYGLECKLNHTLPWILNIHILTLKICIGYCGDSFNIGSTEVSVSDCNMACAGNGLELCGAGNRLSVYARK